MVAGMVAAGTESRRGEDGGAAPVRSFIAVDLDPAVLTAVVALQDVLREGGGDVRWVRPEGLHVTLRFLGGVEPEVLEGVHTAVREAVAARSTSSLRVRGVGGFPSLRRPRVLWVGLQDDGVLGELAEAVAAALTPLGFPPPEHPFRAHATIGRVNSMRGWQRFEEILRAHEDDDLGTSRLRAVVVYRSILQRGGSVYTPLWTIPLTENRGSHHDA